MPSYTRSCTEPSKTRGMHGLNFCLPKSPAKTQLSQRVVLLFDNDSHTGDWVKNGAIASETHTVACPLSLHAGRLGLNICHLSTIVSATSKSSARTGEHSSTDT